MVGKGHSIWLTRKELYEKGLVIIRQQPCKRNGAAHTNIKTTLRYLKYHLRTLEEVIRGKVVHDLFMPSKQIQIPEKIGPRKLGGKGSNLG